MRIKITDEVVPKVGDNAGFNRGERAREINRGEFVPQSDYSIEVKMTGHRSTTIIVLKLILTRSPSGGFGERNVLKDRHVVRWRF